MAKLEPYFGPDTTGKTNRIMVQTLWWNTVGHGKYDEFGDYKAVFSGNIKIAGIYSGDFDLTLTLTDKNPGATLGPCIIILNGASHEGKYTVSGKELHIAFEAENKSYVIKFHAGGGGTYVGGLPLYGWIGP